MKSKHLLVMLFLSQDIKDCAIVTINRFLSIFILTDLFLPSH